MGGRKGQIPWNKGKKLHYTVWSKGKKLQIKHDKQFKKGHIPWHTGTKGIMKAWNKDKKTGLSPWLGKKRDRKTKKKISKSLMGRYIGELSPRWVGGSKIYPLGWTKTYREQIRYRDKYKCQMCGCSEVENIRKLPVHHIDYNKDNIDPNNLISLCTSCHGKTSRNKNRNLFIEKLERIIK